MSPSEQEIEVKFLINSLEGIQQKLEGLGAVLSQPRTHEINLRFDRPNGSLSKAHQVLRLRQDQEVHLTFKGPARAGEAVSVRTEIEFEASDFTAARHFLEALGYQVAVMYEKYRAVYRLGEVLVTLDELPFGNFIEVEGQTESAIRQTTGLLTLNWEARIMTSYLALFDQLKAKLNLSAHNLSFDELLPGFSSVTALNLPFADQ